MGVPGEAGGLHVRGAALARLAGYRSRLSVKSSWPWIGNVFTGSGNPAMVTPVRALSSVRIECRPPKPKVRGSNPLGRAKSRYRP